MCLEFAVCSGILLRLMYHSRKNNSIALDRRLRCSSSSINSLTDSDILALTSGLVTLSRFTLVILALYSGSCHIASLVLEALTLDGEPSAHRSSFILAWKLSKLWVFPLF